MSFEVSVVEIAELSYWSLPQVYWTGVFSVGWAGQLKRCLTSCGYFFHIPGSCPPSCYPVCVYRSPAGDNIYISVEGELFLAPLQDSFSIVNRRGKVIEHFVLGQVADGSLRRCCVHQVQ